MFHASQQSINEVLTMNYCCTVSMLMYLKWTPNHGTTNHSSVPVGSSPPNKTSDTIPTHQKGKLKLISQSEIWKPSFPSRLLKIVHFTVCVIWVLQHWNSTDVFLYTLSSSVVCVTSMPELLGNVPGWVALWLKQWDKWGIKGIWSP